MDLTEEAAARFADIALSYVQREYPNKLDHVIESEADVRSPNQLHPIFYDSFDWHSCVHSYWMLARLLRRFPTMEPAGRVRSLFDSQFVYEKVASDALAIMKESPAHALLTDVMMPGPMDGVTLASKVKALWPRTQIVIASGMIRLARKDLAKGMHFFPKPVPLPHLVDILKRRIVGF